MAERKLNPSGIILTIASVTSGLWDEPRTGDDDRRWKDGRGSKRPRHGSVRVNRTKAKAARQARKKNR